MRRLLFHLLLVVALVGLINCASPAPSEHRMFYESISPTTNGHVWVVQRVFGEHDKLLYCKMTPEELMCVETQPEIWQLPRKEIFCPEYGLPFCRETTDTETKTNSEVPETD